MDNVNSISCLEQQNIFIHASNKSEKHQTHAMPYVLFPRYKQWLYHAFKAGEIQCKSNSRLSIPFKIHPGLHRVKEKRRQTLDQVSAKWICFVLFFFPLPRDQLKNLRQIPENYHSKIIDLVQYRYWEESKLLACILLFCCTNTFVCGYFSLLHPRMSTSK